jgi:hypothetical protein
LRDSAPDSKSLAMSRLTLRGGHRENGALHSQFT